MVGLACMTLEAPVWSTEPPTRVFVGVGLGSRTNRLKVALLRCRGEGLATRCIRADAVTLPASQLHANTIGGSILEAVLALVRTCEVPIAAVDVLGLDSLGDLPLAPIATTIAEKTGVTVVSDFALRDRACGGRGSPLSPLPDWFLFRHPKKNRLLLHLGGSLQVMLLPGGEPAPQVGCFESGPCCEFLDHLVRDLSNNRYPFDPSGHFAVQGALSEDLVAQWSSHPYLLRPPPKFLPAGEFSAGMLEASLTFARERRLSARDVLCSANQFVVRCLHDAVQRFMPGQAIDEIWASGGGIWNGFLWKLLKERSAPTPVFRIDEGGIPSEARRAVHAGLLAFFAMENLSGNLHLVSGASQPRVLGQITPGSAENWDRWVCNLADRFEIESKRAA